MGVALLLIVITLVPFLCGTVIMGFMHTKNRSVAGMYASGWFVMFALFEVVAVPFIITKRSFHLMADVYTVVVLLVALVGAFFVKRVWVSMGEQATNREKSSRLCKIGYLVVGVLVIVQMLFLVFHQYYDGDDAYYVAVALDSYDKDVMYMHSAYTGYPYPEVEMRHALSPVPVWIAWLSKLSEIHPTIIAHTVLGPVFIGLMYLIYGLIGRRLLHDRKNWVPVFILFVMLFYVFGHVTIYTAETFAYTRTWQGKSMYANLVIPMMYLALLYVSDKKWGLGEWVLMWLAIVSGAFCTSVSIFFGAVFIVIFGICLSFYRKEKRDIPGMIACLLPCLVLGLLYIRG